MHEFRAYFLSWCHTARSWYTHHQMVPFQRHSHMYEQTLTHTDQTPSITLTTDAGLN